MYLKQTHVLRVALFSLLALSLLGVLNVSTAGTAFAASGEPITRVRDAHGRFAQILPTPAAYERVRGKAGKDGIPADSTTNMSYHGGPVMRSPVNYLIFWQPSGTAFATNYTTLNQRYFQDVGGTPFYNVVTQYGDSSGVTVPNAASYGGTWVDTNAFPHAGTNADPVTDGDLQTAVNDAITANPGWQPPGLGTMYFVYTGYFTSDGTPVESCFNSTNCFAANGNTNGTYCAYHDFFDSNKIYASQPYASLGSCYDSQTAYPNNQAYDVASSAVSHEMLEANTDPLLNAWYDDVSGIAGEIGDKCAYNYGTFEPDGTNIVLHGLPYQMQREWSNNPFTGCVKRYGPDAVTSVTSSADFGTVPRGTTATRNVVISNSGAADLNVLNIRLATGSDPQYSLLNVPPTTATIPPTDSVTLTLRFAPFATDGSPGPYNATVVVDTDDPEPNGTTYNVSITGQAGIPTATLSASSINFGGVATDDRTSPDSVSRSLTISNTGTADLTLQSVVPTGDFIVSSPVSLPATIAGGSSLTVSVIFNPSVPGPGTGTLAVNTDDPVNPALSVNLSGTGLVPAISASPSSLIFQPTVLTTQVPGWTGTTSNVNVLNTGQAELIVDSVATASPFSAPGAASPPNRYAPTAGFTVPVTFGPTATGKFTGTLTIADNGNGEAPVSASVPLCGEGVTRGIRVLVINGSGTPYASVDKLHLSSHGTSPVVSIVKKNLPLTSVTTSCVSGQQEQYENQNLPAAPGGSSYYVLTVSVGGKSANLTFSLGTTEFKTITITVK